jgi:hypothetical protein
MLAMTTEGETKRGRPPGAKNKPKEPEFKHPVTITDAERKQAEYVEELINSPVPKIDLEHVVGFNPTMKTWEAGPMVAPPTPAPTLSRVVVRKGLTINTGNFQNAKIEVEMEMTGGGVDVAELGARVDRELERQAAPFMTLDPNPKVTK